MSSSKPKRFVVGVDSAGARSLAGPVMAGAVLLGPAVVDCLGDFKTASEKRRAEVAEIVVKECMAYSVAEATVAEIDELKIHEAVFVAIQRAVSMLVICPDEVLVNGKAVPGLPYPARPVEKGDTSVPEIMAATVLAKHGFDMRMKKLHRQHPEYDFDHNKGHPTKKHLEALKKHGPCEIHRKSFAKVKEALNKG